MQSITTRHRDKLSQVPSRYMDNSVASSSGFPPARPRRNHGRILLPPPQEEGSPNFSLVCKHFKNKGEYSNTLHSGHLDQDTCPRETTPPKIEMNTTLRASREEESIEATSKCALKIATQVGIGMHGGLAAVHRVFHGEICMELRGYTGTGQRVRSVQCAYRATCNDAPTRGPGSVQIGGQPGKLCE